jgi:hypothetical protein
MQLSTDVASTTSEYVPTTHAVHSVVAISAANLPASQLVQGVVARRSRSAFPVEQGSQTELSAAATTDE